MAALARRHAAGGRDRAQGRWQAARHLRPRRAGLSRGGRLLAPEHEHAGPGAARRSALGGRRVPTGCARPPPAQGDPRHRGRARLHADHAGLRLSHSAAAALRLRPGGRPDRQRHLRHPANGPQHAARPAAGPARRQGIGRHERLHAAPGLLACRGADSAAADPGRHQPDDHGRAQRRHHRLDHRRLRGHRLGGAVLHAQGRIRWRRSSRSPCCCACSCLAAATCCPAR